MKKIILLAALALAISACAPNRVLVKNCTKVGPVLSECEKVQDL